LCGQGWFVGFLRGVLETLEWLWVGGKLIRILSLRKANLIIEIGDAESIIDNRPLLPESNKKGLAHSRKTIG
jgi:hypothetical protein